QLTILAADFGTLALSVALGAVVMLIAAGWSLPESSPALGWLRITWACGSMLILLGLGWMWRSFHTHDFARVMALAEQANENESGRAMVQLQRLSLGAGS